jgi:predicted DsbA family dithiol-disulfide isomerase
MLRIDLYADLVCPWCWIGERRLARALAASGAAAEVRLDLRGL